MRRYIRKETLDSTLYTLVEKQEPQLLDICLELSKYRSEETVQDTGHIQNMLAFPRRSVLAAINIVLSLVGCFFLVKAALLFSASAAVFAFAAALVAWFLYLGYEIVYLFKIWRTARRYVLVDELMDREMIQIGFIYPDL